MMGKMAKPVWALKTTLTPFGGREPENFAAFCSRSIYMSSSLPKGTCNPPLTPSTCHRKAQWCSQFHRLEACILMCSARRLCVAVCDTISSSPQVPTFLGGNSPTYPSAEDAETCGVTLAKGWRRR